MILSLSVPSKQADKRINDIDLVHQYQRALTTPTNVSLVGMSNECRTNEADTMWNFGECISSKGAIGDW